LYEEFFGFRSKPFALLPDPDFLFLSKTHKRVLTYLDYGISERSGFILLTGEVGSGKTTLIRNLLRKKLEHVVISKVFNTKVSSEQLISMVNDDFGLDVKGKDKITLLRELNDFLIRQFALGNQAVLIIDEAQNLSPELLEEIRMLSNLESDRQKFLQIVLVGQPELRKVLSLPELLQLRQRISVNCHIAPLSLEEAEQYILHRLEKAGNRDAAAFSPEALELVFRHSRGVPRLINIICDYLLLAAFASQVRIVDQATVAEVIADLDFETQFWQTEPRPEGPQPAEDRPDKGGRSASSKLTALIRNMNQRIDALESEASRIDQNLLLEVSGKVDELEHLVARQDRALRDMLAELEQRGGQGQPQVVPAEAAAPRVQEEPAPARQPEDVPPSVMLQRKEPARPGFFRRLFNL
jgi:putative secretion ATPase (PEP-CTERM system associated)